MIAELHDFATAHIPAFEQPGGPSPEQLDAFVADAYAREIVVAFDWIEWRDQAHVLLETSGALQRTDLDDLRRLVTLLIRQERYAEGTLAHAVQQGWLHHVLTRMRELSAGEFISRK